MDSNLKKLTTVGIIMASVNLSSGILLFSVTLYDMIEIRVDKGFAYMFFIIITCVIYIVGSVMNCAICCSCFDKDPVRVLTATNIFSVIIIALDIITGFLTYLLHPEISITFFIFGLLAFSSLLITIKARSELIAEQVVVIDRFNRGQDIQENLLERYMMPKYAVIIEAEKVEV